MPRRFGRYVLLDEVAQGGMATVWRARLSGEGAFQRILAIKKILPHVSDDADFIEMFTNEALLTASLIHSNVGQVYEFSRQGDCFYIAMEYISGKDLKSVWKWAVKRGEPLPFELSALIVAKMCEGLEHAHSRKDADGEPACIVHRDVSPQNVLLSWDGDVKVIDFGIAKATAKEGKTNPGTLKGKYAYMAPEQIRGLALDGRADIFPLGVVLYELVTNQRAFPPGIDTMALLEMVRNVEITPPAIANPALPAELERIIYKALAKDRDQRYRSAQDMADDLQQFLLRRGRLPQQRDLAAFLGQQFAVERERERMRLLAYRDIDDADIEPDDTDPVVAPVVVATPRTPTPPAPLPAPPTTTTTTTTTQAEEKPEKTENTAATRTNVVVKLVDPAEALAPPPPKTPRALMAAAAVAVCAAVAAVVAVVVLVVSSRPPASLLVVSETPVVVDVRVDDAPVQRAAPSLRLPLTDGPHLVRLSADGYEPLVQTIVAQRGEQTLLPARLLRQTAWLVVESTPPDAAIVVDGRLLDVRTPARIAVGPDEVHRVRLSLPAHVPVELPALRIAAGQQELRAARLRPAD